MFKAARWGQHVLALQLTDRERMHTCSQAYRALDDITKSTVILTHAHKVFLLPQGLSLTVIMLFISRLNDDPECETAVILL